MFEDDYVTRQNREILNTLRKIVFGEADRPPYNTAARENGREAQNVNEQMDDTSEALFELQSMVDDGDINDAENKVYDLIETGDRENMRTALYFYAYLNDKSDDFLEEHQYSRQEVTDGIRNVCETYGLGSLVQVF